MAYTTNPNLPRVRRDAAAWARQNGVRAAALKYGVHPSTVSRWCKKAEKVGHVPICTRSSAPKTHPNALGKEVVSAIIAKRLGRRRCGQVIHQELLREGVEVSLSSVQRTLSRTRLVKRRSPWKRSHDFVPRPQAEYPGALLQCDTVHIMLPDGKRMYVYTLIDLYSRWAYAEVVSKIGSEISFEFIERAAVAAPFVFEMIQTDNGPEFQKMFLFRLARRGIRLRHSRVRRSNDNAHVERFNRTMQEECLDRAGKTPEQFQKALAEYLPYYNGERLHMGIDYQTPMEVLRRC